MLYTCEVFYYGENQLLQIKNETTLNYSDQPFNHMLNQTCCDGRCMNMHLYVSLNVIHFFTEVDGL